MQNQSTTSDAIFKKPLTPHTRNHQNGSSLFNDIVEELNTAMREQLFKFLKFQPYHKFRREFDKFMRRTTLLMQQGNNNSRLTNSTQTSTQTFPTNYRSSSSLNNENPATVSMTSNNNSTLKSSENNVQPANSVHLFNPPVKSITCANLQSTNSTQTSTQTFPTNYRPSSSLINENPATVSMTSKNNSTLKSSENIVQPANPVNPFNPPVESITSANLQPSNLSLPHIVQSVNQSQSTSNMLCTSRPSTIVTKGKLQSDFNPLEPVATEQSKSSNNNSNSKESLAQNVGIKIAVGLPENNNNTTNESNTTQHQSTSIKNYLSEWSVDLKEIDVPMNTTKIVLLITGTLLNDDQTTVIEKCHNAGILVSRKDNNLVKTKNGIYRLIGNIARGSPDVLYEKILVAHGIPKTWKYILNKLYNADKGTKKKQFNFILDSPAKPFKLMKNINLDKSLTRSGKIYKQHCNVLDTKNTNRKKKSLIFYPSGSNNSEHRKCLPLCASTPRNRKKQASILETQSQILEN